MKQKSPIILASISMLAVAMCCMSLTACDNDNDSDKLSPVELEILELDELIASQPELDEEAFIADLLKGTMKMTSHYIMNNGKFEELLVDGGTIPCVQTVFFEDGTCRDCHTINPIGENGAPSDWIDTYSEYDWRYDGDTRSVITHAAYDITSAEGEPIYYDESPMKVLYYNTDNNRLILEGSVFEHVSETIRMSGYIDIDAAERERILEKYCDSKAE